MKLTQGLLPSSSGIDDNIFNEDWSHPDDQDGYEFGTWDLYHNNYFTELLGEIKKDVKTKEIPGSAYIWHKFTEEERKIIHTSLLNDWEKKEKRGKIGMFCKFDKEWGIYPQYHQRLIELFSKTDDLPVWYWYD